MTIKDIAKLAGVSVSTVSKVMNQKDSSISPATRDKVLKIVKEYNYSPYATSNFTRGSKTLLIGVMMSKIQSNPFLSGLFSTAQKHGYTLLVIEHHSCHETELKNITTLIKHNVDGVLWEPISNHSLGHISHFEKAGICVQIYNTPFYPDSFLFDYEAIGYAGTKALIDFNHRNIACLTHKNLRAQLFLEGYKKCLYDHHISYDENLLYYSISEPFLASVANRQISAVVAADYSIGLKLIEAFDELHIEIPYELSIVAMKRDASDSYDYPKLSSIIVPLNEYGVQLCENLIHSIEKSPSNYNITPLEFTVTDNSTISYPYDYLKPKILTLGSVNIDYYMKMDRFPNAGESEISSSFHTYPGGKAINQAIGAAKLGAKATTIGAIGNDFESGAILSALKSHNIDTIGITRNSHLTTGKALIILNSKGESVISLLPAANLTVTPEFVRKHERMFKNANYCLLSTEIPLDGVLEASILAKKHNATVILKPPAIVHLNDEIIKNIDILVPNYNELETIAPHFETLEDRANYFLEKGVKVVVVTLGADGCFLKTKKISKYYKTTNTKTIDDTGAGDAFIAALSVYLQKGFPLENAVQIANYAAGFSITREGVIPSLVDTSTLEAYINQVEPMLLNYK